MLFDDDPGKTAEDKMSDAFCCVLLLVIAALAFVGLLVWLVIRSL